MIDQWNQSSVMREFEKIAIENKLLETDLNPEDKDFVGNPSTMPNTPTRYEPTEEYTKVKDDLKDLLDKAHPKTIETVKSDGSGGVVENLIEQQEKGVEIATKMPTGALYGVHAELIKSLTKTANKLEERGKIKEAKRIDECLKKLSNNPLVKEAFWGAAIGLLGLIAPFVSTMIGRAKYPSGAKGPRRQMGTAGKIITGLGGAFTILSALGNKFTSLKEDIRTDLKDLYEILSNTKATNAKKAAELLAPFLNTFEKPLDEKGFKKFVIAFKEMGKIQPKLDKLIAKIEIELGPGRWYQFGFDVTSKIKEKYQDFLSTYEETKELINKAEGFGEKMENTAKAIATGIPETNNVTDLQKILFRDPDKITGKLDITTVNAVETLEKNIDRALRDLGKDYSIKGKIIQNGKVSIKPEKLKRLLNLIEKAKE